MALKVSPPTTSPSVIRQNLVQHGRRMLERSDGLRSAPVAMHKIPQLIAYAAVLRSQVSTVQLSALAEIRFTIRSRSAHR
jgi:hypothetical protein